MEGMEWAGGMTPMQLQIQVEHERRVEALLEKAIAEDDAKRAAKAAAKSAKKQAAAARRHQRVRRSASSTSVFRSRARQKEDNAALVTTESSPDRATSGRSLVPRVRSESPPPALIRLAMRERMHSFSTSVGNLQLKLGDLGEPRAKSECSPSRTATPGFRNAHQLQKARTFFTRSDPVAPRPLREWFTSGVGFGWALRIATPSSGSAASTLWEEGEGDGDCDSNEYVPPLLDVLSNRAKEPFDLKSFLRFATRNFVDENVLFYLEVNAFKAAGGGEMEYLARVKRIHDLYIAPTGPREVNISCEDHTATSAVVSAILNCGRDLQIPPEPTTIAPQPLHVQTEEDSPKRELGADGTDILACPNGEHISQGGRVEDSIGYCSYQHSDQQWESNSDGAPPFLHKLGDEAAVAHASREPRAAQEPRPDVDSRGGGADGDIPLNSRVHSKSCSTDHLDITGPAAVTTCIEGVIGHACDHSSPRSPALPRTPIPTVRFLGCDNEVGKEPGSDLSLKELPVVTLPMELNAVELCSSARELRGRYVAEDGQDVDANERRRRYSHVDSLWLCSEYSARSAGADGTWGGLGVTGLLAEIGADEGDLVGDRSIFDVVQKKIFDLLDGDAYPRFVAECLKQKTGRGHVENPRR